MNKPDLTRDYCMLTGPLTEKGYDWWWHSFTGHHEKTGEPRTFFVEYFVCNPARAQEEPVIVWNDPEARARGERPSYLMVKAGSWAADKAQLHRFMPWREVSLKMHAPLVLAADDCTLSETYIAGSVDVSEETVREHPEYMCDAGSMKWELNVDKQVTFNVGYGASEPFRLINAFQMFWHAEGMKTQYEGEVTYNGECYIVTPETSYGYADKNWGSDFTSPWVWLSSCNLTSAISGKKLENSVFDIGGGRPRVYGVSLGRQLLGAFFYEGTNYEFNFSKFWTGCRTKFDCGETDDLVYWRITMTTFTARLDIEAYCEKDEMVWANYESPDGMKRFKRLWNGGTGFGKIRLYERTGVNVDIPEGPSVYLPVGGAWRLVDDMYAENMGCEYGVYG